MKHLLRSCMILVVVAIFASAQTTKAPQHAATHDIQRYAIVNFEGDSMSGSWDSEESPNLRALRARYGEHFAWFREGDREYVITDPGVMAELDKADEPQKKVNALQANVNQDQSRVNDMQAKVNEHQKNVNEMQHEVNRRQKIADQLQSAVSHGSSSGEIEKLESELREMRGKPEVSQASVNQMQSQVNEEQHGVNAEQAKVNEKQHGVNDVQHQVSADFAVRVRQIFSKALENGTAQPLK